MFTVKPIELMRAGAFEELARLFSPDLRAAVSAETVRLAWTTELARIGEVTVVGEPVRTPVTDELTRFSVPITGERGGFTVVMSLDQGGTMFGLRLAPARVAEWRPPDYVSPGRFREREVTVGGQPGTLSVPRGFRKPRAGVVLLGGGGPFDRDGSAGDAKPLKDLAWGLASRGVAVARFDKPTGTATVTDEYQPAARDAIRLLREHTARVFVLGHSLGGKVAPRVAAAEPSVAGLVLLAAEAQPMHHSAVRVVTRLGDPATIADVTRQAALIDSDRLTPDTPAADLPLGLPASYWLDLRSYDPAATAAALDRPMLILQGARDDQVTVDDDLPLWRAALAGRDDVTFRVYDADDHLFLPPDQQHVDRQVIEDVAAWLVS